MPIYLFPRKADIRTLPRLCNRSSCRAPTHTHLVCHSCPVEQVARHCRKTLCCRFQTTTPEDTYYSNSPAQTPRFLFWTLRLTGALHRYARTKRRRGDLRRLRRSKPPRVVGLSLGGRP